jgi:Fe-S oxidoreductase
VIRPYAEPAKALAAKTYELTSFLVDVMGMPTAVAEFEGSATYHDSCSGLRELGVKSQPRRLLKGVAGLEMKEMANEEVCCGFGGTFCVKYPDVSNKMVSEKTAAIAESGADVLLAGDLGCLLNMSGKLSREGSADPRVPRRRDAGRHGRRTGDRRSGRRPVPLRRDRGGLSRWIRRAAVSRKIPSRPSPTRTCSRPWAR